MSTPLPWLRTIALDVAKLIKSKPVRDHFTEMLSRWCEHDIALARAFQTVRANGDIELPDESPGSRDGKKCTLRFMPNRPLERVEKYALVAVIYNCVSAPDDGDYLLPVGFPPHGAVYLLPAGRKSELAEIHFELLTQSFASITDDTHRAELEECLREVRADIAVAENHRVPSSHLSNATGSSGFRLADDFIDIAETIRWKHCAPSNPAGWLSGSIPQGGIVPWNHKLMAAGRALEDWLCPRIGEADAHALVGSILYRIETLTHHATRIHDNPQNHDALMPEFQRVFNRSDLGLCYAELLRSIPGGAGLVDRFIHHVDEYVTWDAMPGPYPQWEGDIPDDSPAMQGYIRELNDRHGRLMGERDHVKRYGERLADVLVSQKRDATGVFKVVHGIAEGAGPSSVRAYWGDLRAQLKQVAIEIRSSLPAQSQPRSKKLDKPDLSKCPVEIDYDNIPIVCGKRKEKLSEAKHRVIKKLVEIFPGGLSKDGLERFDGGARRTLNELRRDPDWDAVLPKPGKPGQGGYRIAWPK